jgi:hypothetical protein
MTAGTRISTGRPTFAALNPMEELNDVSLARPRGSGCARRIRGTGGADFPRDPNCGSAGVLCGFRHLSENHGPTRHEDTEVRPVGKRHIARGPTGAALVGSHPTCRCLTNLARACRCHGQPLRNLLTRRDGGRPVRHLRNAARAPTHVEVTKDRPGLTQAAAQTPPASSSTAAPNSRQSGALRKPRRIVSRWRRHSSWPW